MHYSLKIIFLYLLLGQLQIKALDLEPAIHNYLVENQFSGAVLIAKGEKILVKQGYGYANLEHQILNTPQTVFRIASITKQFTAAAILKLQEKELLNVLDSVTKYLPEYPEFQKITIHHLLSHTSGIQNLTSLKNINEIQRIPTTPDLTLSYIKHLPLNFTPGSECEYSDSNYIILGAIIEKVTQKSYATFLQENIFHPLKMDSTFVESTEMIIPKKANGYRKDPQKKTLLPALYIDMSLPFSAGAIATTVEDLYKWILALHKGSLVTQMSHKNMTTKQGESVNHPITYGYGLRVGPQNKGFENCFNSIIGHLGTIDGFKAAAIYYPDTDLILILLSNVEQTDIASLHKHLAIILSTYWRT